MKAAARCDIIDIIDLTLPAWAAPDTVCADYAPCLRGEASSALIRPVHLPVDGGGVPA